MRLPSLTHLPDLALAVADDLIEATARLDRFIPGFHVTERKAGHELIGLGERAVEGT